MTETPSPTMYHVKDIMDVRWFTEDRAKAEAIGAESGCPVEPFYDRAALDAARAEGEAKGRREALDEAEAVALREMDYDDVRAHTAAKTAVSSIAVAIRALIDKETDR